MINNLLIISSVGLSPLLDEVAVLFNKWKRDGRGGRFYLRDGTFFDADDRVPFLRVDIREDAPESRLSGRRGVGGGTCCGGANWADAAAGVISGGSSPTA